MPILTGKRLGPYEILSAIGAGGMGEVYRARDTRLNRDVAIKVLPEVFADDADRMARFEREARVLAALNHPHIAAIYGVEESNSSRALVMELVDGPTLADRMGADRIADRMGAGPIPLDEALAIAKQIAEALEYAHDKGVIHRDLKPANIKVTADGTVKVLDFGLAKALLDKPTAADPSNSPTLSMNATVAGVILGTAAYMSPEQARGKTVDRRADIWAFGVVLFEMLTGRAVFAGEDVSETLAFVMTKEPAFDALPAKTPLAVRNLLQRCLAKDVRQRLQHIGEARFALEHAGDTPAAPVTVPVGSPLGNGRLAWAVAAIAIVAALVLAFAYFNRAPADQETNKVSVLPPSNAAISSDSAPAISPDGRRLAFVAQESSGKSLLWVRPLNSLIAQSLAGTEDARQPFWSPDSRFIGFFASGKLKKVDASGGPPQTLCEVGPGTFGGTWNQNGAIIFAEGIQPLLTVPAAGGQPRAATALDSSRQEREHLFPHFLPDGRHFLYLALSAKRENGGTYVGSLDSKDAKRLLGMASEVNYAPPGYLLFVSDGTLMAQPFNTSRLSLSGEPFPIAEQVLSNPVFGDAMFSASESGVLAYRGGAFSGKTQLTWFDRTGKQLGIVGPPGEYLNPELSPDGKRVAVEQKSAQGHRDIWLLELSGGAATRFTFNPVDEYYPIWSPDGSHIVFASDREGSYGLYLKPSSGVGSEELLLKSATEVAPFSWSSDGRFIVYRFFGTKGHVEEWGLPMSGDRKPFALLRSEEFSYAYAKLSPDGRWVAYMTNESGRNEIDIQTFPKPGGKWQVSDAGGIYPRWSRDGKELFYLAPDGKLTALTVKGDSALEAGVPTALFETHMVGGPRNVVGFRQQYDVASGSQRFLINVPVAEETSSPITLVLNWTAGLKK